MALICVASAAVERREASPPRYPPKAAEGTEGGVAPAVAAFTTRLSALRSPRFFAGGGRSWLGKTRARMRRENEFDCVEAASPLPTLPRKRGRRRAGPLPAAARRDNFPLLRGSFHRVLHVRKSLELGVPELPVYLFDLAHVDVVHDVAGVRIDRDRAARAFPGHALHRCDQSVAVGVAARLLERFVEEVHAVIAAQRDEIRTEMVVLLDRRDIGPVERGIVRGGIGPGGDHAEHLI